MTAKPVVLESDPFSPDGVDNNEILHVEQIPEGELYYVDFAWHVLVTPEGQSLSDSEWQVATGFGAPPEATGQDRVDGGYLGDQDAGLGGSASQGVGTSVDLGGSTTGRTTIGAYLYPGQYWGVREVFDQKADPQEWVTQLYCRRIV